MKKTAIYLNNPVSFLSEGDQTMVNATEMAKAFNKQPSDWLRLGSTRLFITALESQRGIPRNAMSQVVKGQGSYFNEDLALEFARWLSPEFAIWTNDRIKEFAKFGFTAKPETLEEMLANPDLVIGLATKLKESRMKLNEANKTIAIQAPKVEFVEEVFEAPTLLTMGEAAKMLGFGRNTLFAILRKKRILMSGLRQNEPYQTFIERGYFELKGAKVGSRSAVKVVPQTFVTTRGLAWLRLNV